jgi:hypothetical protein
LASTQDFVDPTAMMLFSEKDKRIRMPEADEVDRDPVDGEEVETMPEVEYVASLVVVKDRLEFMGYALAKAHAEFQQGIEDNIAQTSNMMPYYINHDIDLVPHLEAEIQLLKTITFADWLDALGFIFRLFAESCG